MINATLIVQIIHFGIACFALDRLLLAKAVNEVRNEKAKADEQRRLLEQAQARIALLAQEKEKAWLLVQEQMKALIPEYQRYQAIKPLPIEQAAIAISSEKIAAYKNEMAQEIIESVDHVH